MDGWMDYIVSVRLCNMYLKFKTYWWLIIWWNQKSGSGRIDLLYKSGKIRLRPDFL